MFAYKDPTGTDFLENQGALDEYRSILDGRFRQSAKVANSSFTLLEAFSELTAGTIPVISTISWIAFPITAAATAEQIDRDRFRFQDEYVEWRTERDASGNVTQVTFTTEFPEYFEALAQVSLDALMAGIKEVIPGANPTVRELLGTDTDSPAGRDLQFRRQLRNNPWNNGEKGILCLTQQFNTFGALLNLIDKCGIPQPSVNANDVCALVDGACGPDRSSDPAVCAATQNLTRDAQGVSLAEPAGIHLMKLQGTWRVDGRRIEINDPSSNEGLWVVSRGGRRGVLKVIPGMELDSAAITSGAQVSEKLLVGADVIFAPESSLPDWAKIGQENRI